LNPLTAGSTELRRHLLAAAALTMGAACGFSACGQQGGLGLARQACGYVRTSLHDLTLAEQPGTPSGTSASFQTKAEDALRKALPLAADANSSDGSWNSLMTTISESATVDETHLVPALKAQCAVANTNINVNPQT
jgi:hypothetical protein